MRVKDFYRRRCKAEDQGSEATKTRTKKEQDTDHKVKDLQTIGIKVDIHKGNCKLKSENGHVHIRLRQPCSFFKRAQVSLEM